MGGRDGEGLRPGMHRGDGPVEQGKFKLRTMQQARTLEFDECQGPTFVTPTSLSSQWTH